MAALALAKGFYQRGDNTPTFLENMYYEEDPTNLKDGSSLISRPGMTLLGNAGGGFIAGLIRREDSNDTIIGVSGEFVFAVTGNSVGVGSGGVSGSGRVRMATDGVNTFIVRAGKLYNLPNPGAVYEVSMPDGRQVVDVVFLAGRFWIATKNSGRVYFTVPGSVTVDALNYFTAESNPDYLIGLGVWGDELWLFGRSSIEFWTTTADPDLPAQRVIGRQSPAGCASVFSIATTDAGLAWIGDDGIAYRSGALPVPIGNAGISEIIRRARPSLDDTFVETALNGWGFTLDQHIFYVLDVPTAGTYAYDFTTGQWSQFSSLDLELFGAGCAAKKSQGRWIVGSTYTADVLYFDPDVGGDNGQPFTRQFPALIPVDQPQRCNSVILECSVGNASLAYPDDDPLIAERHSDDQGRTWSDWRYESLGLQGEYKTIVSWMRLGSMRNPSRLLEFRTSAQIPFTVRSGRYNQPIFR